MLGRSPWLTSYRCNSTTGFGSVNSILVPFPGSDLKLYFLNCLLKNFVTCFMNFIDHPEKGFLQGDGLQIGWNSTSIFLCWLSTGIPNQIKQNMGWRSLTYSQCETKVWSWFKSWLLFTMFCCSARAWSHPFLLKNSKPFSNLLRYGPRAA